VDEFLTDEQQADRAKQWLRENGVFIAAGVVLGLGGLFGWQQWQEHKLQLAGEASVVWEQLRSAIASDRLNEANETLELLESEYPGTAYLDQARLAMARMHMDKNSPEEALEELKMLVGSGKDEQLRRVAELRIAQIYVYQSEYEAALQILDKVSSPVFAGFYHDLRGDIYFAKGEPELAAGEYRLALDLDASGYIDRSYVQIKLDDVSGSIAVTAAEIDKPDADSESGPEQASTVTGE
jgi:predicted negative regulator of RcsB-dependent stress response